MQILPYNRARIKINKDNVTFKRITAYINLKGVL